MRDALLIANPAAGRRRGRRRRELAAAVEILRRDGIAAELVWTDGAGSARAMARRAARDGREMVILCGGDGTINEAANGLAGSPVPLAVLPGGTANVLAKELRLPWNIPRAAALVARSRPERIALGVVAREEAGSAVERYFVSVGGAGPDGAIVSSLAAALKQRLGQLAFWLEGARQLVRYRFPRFRVRDERGAEYVASMVIVGRTASYGGPFRITTSATLLADAFEVCVITTRSHLRYLSYLPAIWLGSLRRQSGVFFFPTTRLRCEPLGTGPVYAQVDGEPAGRLPVEFRIAPAALTLLIPPGE